MNIVFSKTAWEQYVAWQQEDRAIVKKINALLQSIVRDGPLHGLGKPEALRWRKAYSRRIDSEHRLVYGLDEHKNLLVIACRGHYEE